MTREEAKQGYVSLIRELDPKFDEATQQLRLVMVKRVKLDVSFSPEATSLMPNYTGPPTEEEIRTVIRTHLLKSGESLTFIVCRYSAQWAELNLLVLTASSHRSFECSSVKCMSVTIRPTFLTILNKLDFFAFCRPWIWFSRIVRSKNHHSRRTNGEEFIDSPS